MSKNKEIQLLQLLKEINKLNQLILNKVSIKEEEDYQKQSKYLKRRNIYWKKSYEINDDLDIEKLLRKLIIKLKKQILNFNFEERDKYEKEIIKIFLSNNFNLIN